MAPDQIFKTWHRDTFLVSTKRSFLDPAAINAAFDSDLLWWSSRLPETQLRTMLDNSLCIGLYKLPGSTSPTADDALPPSTQMIGFARLVTDYVTFGYLDDVYVLDEHQGTGLAKWMMQCLDEVLDEWPDLRRCMLITSMEKATRLYERTLGAKEWSVSESREMKVLERRGRGMMEVPGDGR